jgi:hypothetical protein
VQLRPSCSPPQALPSIHYTEGLWVAAVHEAWHHPGSSWHPHPWWVHAQFYSHLQLSSNPCFEELEPGMSI